MLRRILSSDQVRISIFIALGIGILYWPVFLLGYVQVPSDIPPYYDPVMRELNPDGIQPQNYLLSDHINQFYVWHFLAAQSMQNAGKVPLWNPHVLAGQPLVANSQPALFYPPNWLLFWVAPGLVASIRSMFNFMVAGVSTFLFCRSLRVSRLGAALAAISFAFSGALIVGPSHSYANCLVWLPFTLWAVEKMLQRAGTDRLWVVAASFGIGLSILGGHPETTFHNLLVLSLYFLFRLLMLDGLVRTRVKLAAYFGVAVLLGLCLGAIQWMTFFAWLQTASASTLSRGVGWRAESVLYFEDWPYNLYTLVTLLFPSFFGNPVDHTYQWPFPTFQNYLEQSMYFGLIPVALATGAILAPKKRRNVQLAIVATLAIVLLAVALRVPGFELANHFPILDRVNNTRLKWYFTFLGSVAAGFGLDQLSNISKAHSGGARRFLYSVSTVFALGTGAVICLIASKYVLAALGTTPRSGFVYHLLFSVYSLRHVKATISPLLLAAAVVAFSYCLVTRRATHVAVLRYLYVLLTLLELIVLAYGYNTLVPKGSIFPAVTLTEYLKQDDDDFRILSQPPTFWPNYGAVYGLYHVGGYDLPVLGRYADVYEAQGGKGYRQAWSPEWPLVDFMNVKYVISQERYSLEKLELLTSDSYYLYRNKNALPRAYMVYEVQVIDDGAELLEVLTGESFAFDERVLLDHRLPAEQAEAISSLGAQHKDRFDTVEISHYGSDEVKINVFTETPGVLVMSDVFAPGWQAAIDGKPAQLLRANYAFRGLFVDAGTHQVTFTYDPAEFKVGRLLSIIALVVLLTGSTVLWHKDRSKRAIADFYKRNAQPIAGE